MVKLLVLLLIGLGLVIGLKPKTIPERKFRLDSSVSRIEFSPPPRPPQQTNNFQKKTPLRNNQLPIPTVTPTTIPINNSSQDNEEWGKAKQVSDHTWTMKIALDDKMATPQEIFEALNNYRKLHQREALTWDDRLANFAQQRADYFTSFGKTDEHADFISYTDNIDNVKFLAKDAKKKHAKGAKHLFY